MKCRDARVVPRLAKHAGTSPMQFSPHRKEDANIGTWEVPRPSARLGMTRFAFQSSSCNCGNDAIRATKARELRAPLRVFTPMGDKSPKMKNKQAAQKAKAEAAAKQKNNNKAAAQAVKPKR